MAFLAEFRSDCFYGEGLDGFKFLQQSKQLFLVLWIPIQTLLQTQIVSLEGIQAISQSICQSCFVAHMQRLPNSKMIPPVNTNSPLKRYKLVPQHL